MAAAEVSLREERQSPRSYRDMHLLNEVTHTPDVTQRELSQRIGMALGLTNLMLRRLVNKGFIKISGAKRQRIRYLITPNGILEKSRLAIEFLQYSLYFYRRVRTLLREQLAVLAKEGHRRFVLYGPGELAEIAFLTIQEMGLECVGVVRDGAAPGERFLGYHVLKPDVLASHYDRLIVCSLSLGREGVERMLACGIPFERVVLLPSPGMRLAAPEAPKPALPDSMADAEYAPVGVHHR